MREKFKRTKSVRANEHCGRGRGEGVGGVEVGVQGR